MDIQQPIQQPSEQPINQQPIQPVPVVTRPPQNSWKIIILVVIGILVIAGASYGAYYYWQTQNEPVVAPTDETANWQTYKNDKYGFEFKYPSAWIKQIDRFGNVEIKPTATSKEYFSVALLAQSIVQTKSDFKTYRNESFSPFTFAGISAEKGDLQEAPISSPAPGEPSMPLKVTTILFSNNKMEITARKDFRIDFSPPLTMFDEILSTFKFTSQ